MNIYIFKLERKKIWFIVPERTKEKAWEKLLTELRLPRSTIINREDIIDVMLFRELTPTMGFRFKTEGLTWIIN